MDVHRVQDDLLERLARREALPSRDVAIVVAHPDDETIGIGAQLPRLREATMIHVTDGAPRNLADAKRAGFATAEAYAAARHRELEGALAIAGFPREASLRLEFADQQAANNLAAITRRLIEIFMSRRIAHVFTHAYEGGHPDHDATAFCVHQARASGAQIAIYEMPLYRAGEGGRIAQRFSPEGTDPGYLVEMTPDERSLKEAMLAAHVSQRPVTTIFSLDTERFRRAPAYDFNELPNGGDVFYEGRNWGMTGELWLRHVAAAKRELSGRGG